MIQRRIIIVTSDASNLGLGALMMHKENSGEIKWLRMRQEPYCLMKKGTAKSKKKKNF